MHQTLNTAGRPEYPTGRNDYLTMNIRVNTAGYPKVGQLPGNLPNDMKIRQDRVFSHGANEKVQNDTT